MTSYPSDWNRAEGTGTAIFSSCNDYRYLLTRPGIAGSAAAPTVFLMLNPSTADHRVDDPTIRRCRGFAASWGGAPLLVINLYALRSADPAALWKHPDPVGPENDSWLLKFAKEHRDIVCAWGNNAGPDRVRIVSQMLLAGGARLWCLGTTLRGAPKHPLYVPSGQARLPWTPPC